LGDGEAQWHIDQSYMPQPTFGTILFGAEIPPEGGDTWFADLATAYDRLPAALQAQIDGRRVINSVDRHNRREGATRPDLQMTAEQLQRAPDSPHPLVRTHPLLGTRAIYYDPSHSAEVEGLGDAASQALFAALLPHMTQPELINQHHWSVGDVVMWDKCPRRNNRFNRGTGGSSRHGGRRPAIHDFDASAIASRGWRAHRLKAGGMLRTP
jgi:alpha-ketoglutarate-dependent taurine dioxygenase